MVRLDNYKDFALFLDPEGLYSARKILGPNTDKNPWNYSEVWYAARTLEEIIRKIDANAPEDK